MRDFFKIGRGAAIIIVLMLVGSLLIRNFAVTIFFLVVLFAVPLLLGISAGVFDRTSRPRNDDRLPRGERRAPEIARLARTGEIYTHAWEAMRSAGVDPNTLRVKVLDIGMMVFRDNAPTAACRTYPLPDDADYLQPFVQLHVPAHAVGNVHFQITDSDGELLFDHSEPCELSAGRNRVTPLTRLPVPAALPTDGAWELRITAGSKLIALHRFRWENNLLRRELAQDGEIDDEARFILEENRSELMSLDELLGDFADDDTLRRKG